MHPTCEVPVFKPKDSEYANLESNSYKGPSEFDKKFFSNKKNISEVPDDCVWIFNILHFSGNKKEICDPLFYVRMFFNDKVNSFAARKNAGGYLFRDSNFPGKYIPFQKGTVVDDIEKYKVGQFSLKELMSSIYVGDDTGFMVSRPNDYSPIAYFLNSKNKFTFNAPKGEFTKQNIVSINVLPGNKKLYCVFVSNDQKIEKSFEDKEILFAKNFPLESLEKCYSK